LGVRLGWDVLALGNSPKMMWRMAVPYLPIVGLVLLLLGALYAAAVGLFARWSKRAMLGTEYRFGCLSESQVNSSLPTPALHCAGLFLALGLAGMFLADPDKAEGNAVVQLARTSSL